MFNALKIGLIISLILGVQACSSLRMLNPFGDKVSFVEPPKNLSLSKIDYISINKHQSQPALSTKVKTILSKANAGGMPYFKKVVVGNLSADQDLSNAAVIEISVDANNVYDTRTEETRTKCPGKKLVNTCSSDEAYYYKVNCVTRTANVSATLTASSANDNSVLTTKTASSSSESTSCSDRSSPLESKSSLINKALASASLELVGDLIPTHEQRPSDLIDESEEIFQADAELLLSAADLAANNNLVKAEGIYKDLATRYAHHAGLTFNLGYVNHALGNFELASSYYSKALQLAADPDTREDFAVYAKEAQVWLNKGITQVKK